MAEDVRSQLIGMLSNQSVPSQRVGQGDPFFHSMGSGDEYQLRDPRIPSAPSQDPQVVASEQMEAPGPSPQRMLNFIQQARMLYNRGMISPEQFNLVVQRYSGALR